MFADQSSNIIDLQNALNQFPDTCLDSRMKIGAAETEIMRLSRNPVQRSFQINGVTLQQMEKFKYLEVTFSSDGRQDNKLDTRIKKCINAPALAISRTETRAVYKSKAFCLQISFCSYPHIWL